MLTCIYHFVAESLKSGARGKRFNGRFKDPLNRGKYNQNCIKLNQEFRKDISFRITSDNDSFLGKNVLKGYL